MSEIVSRLGGSTSTIYSGYASKAELVQALVIQQAAERAIGAFLSVYSAQ